MGFRTHVRPNGPGKFEGSDLDARICEAVYAASMDGGYESAGSDDMGRVLIVVTSQRRTYLVEEDSQGFATIVEATKAEAAEALAEAQLQESEFYVDGEAE